MIFRRAFYGFLLLITVIMAFVSCSSMANAQQNEAEVAISSAKNIFQNCFDGMKKAEAASANVTKLTSALNDAGYLLSRAQLAFAVGDYENAVNLAVQSQNELSNFPSDAYSLEIEATQTRSVDFLINVVGSVCGTIVVLVVSSLAWILLRRKYNHVGVQKGEHATI